MLEVLEGVLEIAAELFIEVVTSPETWAELADEENEQPLEPAYWEPKYEGFVILRLN